MKFMRNLLLPREKACQDPKLFHSSKQCLTGNGFGKISINLYDWSFTKLKFFPIPGSFLNIDQVVDEKIFFWNTTDSHSLKVWTNKPFFIPFCRDIFLTLKHILNVYILSRCCESTRKKFLVIILNLTSLHPSYAFLQIQLFIQNFSFNFQCPLKISHKNSSLTFFKKGQHACEFYYENFLSKE